MAWKRFGPSFVRIVFKSVYFGFLVSVLSAVIVGIFSILVYYLTFQTQLNCLLHPEKSIPTNYNGSELSPKPSLSSFFIVGFSPTAYFIVVHFKLILLLTALAFYICDVCYRVIQALVFSHFNLTHLQVLPGNVLFFLCLCIQVCIITKHFCRGPRNKQLSLFLSLTIPCFLTYVTGILVTYFIYPVYNRQDHIVGKALIAIFAPLISVLLKGVSRFWVQRLWRISHPGYSFVLLVPFCYGSAVMLRLLQVDF